jgi:hypothetical protein
VPPDADKRFSVVVDGVQHGDLIHAWSELCQPGEGPPSDAFKAVYPFVTTVQGNRFRFRGGDASQLKGHLEAVLRDKLHSTAVKTRVEG